MRPPGKSEPARGEGAATRGKSGSESPGKEALSTGDGSEV